MEQKPEKREMLELRCEMYRFLSRLYILEVDTKLLGQLKELEFPKTTSDDDWDEGYKLIGSYLREFDENVDVKAKLDDLAVDYADVFLAAGVAQGLAAFPYESVYTSKKKLIMQEANEQVHMIYAEKGFILSEDFPKGPEDHIAAEMEFMAYLCEEAVAALIQGDEERFKINREEQKSFYKNHLRGWVPLFCQDVDKYAKTLFYKGVSKVTAGFIRWEDRHGLSD